MKLPEPAQATARLPTARRDSMKSRTQNRPIQVIEE